MGAVQLALIAALGFGCSDVLGGAAARRDGRRNIQFSTAVISSIVATPVTALFATTLAGGNPVAADYLWAAAAGVFLASARPLVMLGMSRGPVVVFGPALALSSLVVSTTAGLTAGERLAANDIVALLLALPAVVLVSSSGRLVSMRQVMRSSAVLLALAAGVLAGMSSVMLSHVGEDAGAWPLAIVQLAAFLAGTAAAVSAGVLVVPASPARRLAAVHGAVSALAVTSLGLALQAGRISVVAVIISLSPAVSVLIARAVMKDVIHPVQGLGVACAVLSVVLFSI